MNKRILAVGNGNELLEATPQGNVIRWTWDERMKRYSPIVEDDSSAYAARLQPVSIKMATKEPFTSIGTQPGNVISLPSDDYFGAGR